MDKIYKTYILIFIIVVVFAIVIAVGCIGMNSLGCDFSGYDEDTFLAYCENKNFGDYEHGAFYYALEPKAVENLKNADAVILGNSVAMFAFSTSAVDHFFKERGIQYFILGFGYGEASSFPLSLMQRYGIKPKMLIIANAYEFFANTGMTQPATEVTSNRTIIWLKYRAKKMMQNFHKQLCEEVPLLCSPRHRTIYRSVSTGRWFWEAYNTKKHIPLIPDVSYNNSNASERAGMLGEHFIKALPMPIDRSCIVLAGVPYPQIASEAVASSLAKALDARLLNVSVNGMSTIDGTHFDVETAERWSEEFVGKLDPYLSACISNNKPLSQKTNFMSHTKRVRNSP
jgi:hypothetical protein